MTSVTKQFPCFVTFLYMEEGHKESAWQKYQADISFIPYPEAYFSKSVQLGGGYIADEAAFTITDSTSERFIVPSMQMNWTSSSESVQKNTKLSMMSSVPAV